MNTSISESNSSVGGCQKHLGVSVSITLILNRAGEIGNRHLESCQGPNVADGVAALVSRAKEGVAWPWGSPVVRNGSERLECMTKDIKPASRPDCRGGGHVVLRVHNSQSG